MVWVARSMSANSVGLGGSSGGALAASVGVTAATAAAGGSALSEASFAGACGCGSTAMLLGSAAATMTGCSAAAAETKKVAQITAATPPTQRMKLTPRARCLLEQAYRPAHAESLMARDIFDAIRTRPASHAQAAAATRTPVRASEAQLPNSNSKI